MENNKTNIIIAERNRSLGHKGWNSHRSPLKQYGDRVIASLSLKNSKFELPPRTRTTFITAFSPDNSLLASCHGDHNIHILDVKTKKLVKSLSGHERSPWCVTFHPGSNEILATGSLNGEVRVWDLRGDGSESWTVDNNELVAIASLSFHPYDHVLAIAAGNEIHFWDWSLPHPFASVKTNLESEKVRFVRFDPWGHSIITGVVNSEDDEETTEEPTFDHWSWLFAPSSRTLRSGETVSRPRLSGGPSLRRRNALIGRPVTLDQPSRDSTRLTARETLERLRYSAQRRRRGYRFNADRGRMDNHAETEEYSPPTQTPVSEPVDEEERADGSSRIHLAETHQRILHARVSVNAEIQQQYTRLQMLRQERHRLELRLRELQNSANEVRNSTPMIGNSDVTIPQESDSVEQRQVAAPYTRSIRNSVREQRRRLLESLNITQSTTNSDSTNSPPTMTQETSFRTPLLQTSSASYTSTSSQISASLLPTYRWSMPPIAPYVSFRTFNSDSDNFYGTNPEQPTSFSPWEPQNRTNNTNLGNEETDSALRASYNDTVPRELWDLALEAPSRNYDTDRLMSLADTAERMERVQSPAENNQNDIMQIDVPDVQASVTLGAVPRSHRVRYRDFRNPPPLNDYGRQFEPSAPENIQMQLEIPGLPNTGRDSPGPASSSMDFREPFSSDIGLLDLSNISESNRLQPVFPSSSFAEPTSLLSQEPVITSSSLLGLDTTSEHESRRLFSRTFRQLQSRSNRLEQVSSNNEIDILTPSSPSNWSTTAVYEDDGTTPLLSSQTRTPSMYRYTSGSSQAAPVPLPLESIRPTTTNIEDTGVAAADSNNSENQTSRSSSTSSLTASEIMDLASSPPPISTPPSEDYIFDNSNMESRLSSVVSLSTAVDSLMEATDSLSAAADNLLRDTVNTESNFNSTSAERQNLFELFTSDASQESISSTGASSTSISIPGIYTPSSLTIPIPAFEIDAEQGIPGVHSLLPSMTSSSPFLPTEEPETPSRLSVLARARNSERNRPSRRHPILRGREPRIFPPHESFSRDHANMSANPADRYTPRTYNETSPTPIGLRPRNMMRREARPQRQDRRLRNSMRSNINRIISTVYAENNGHRAVVLNIDNTSYRLQYWDFTKLKLPEISRSDVNVIVPHCKIYNDASVDISQDGRLLATFVPTFVGCPDSMMNVGVFSLESNNFGELLYKKSYGPNAVCLSISPLCNYICVGLKSRQFFLGDSSHNRYLMGEILELTNKNKAEMPVKRQVSHPAQDRPHRPVSINTISWSPQVGGGLVYGTNNGDLRLCTMDSKRLEKQDECDYETDTAS